jgi:hypothetical protein
MGVSKLPGNAPGERFACERAEPKATLRHTRAVPDLGEVQSAFPGGGGQARPGPSARVIGVCPLVS